MAERLKRDIAWRVAALIHEPLFLYLAILGVGRLVGANGVPPVGLQIPLLQGVLPIAWKVPLIVILVIDSGLRYIGTCLRTIRWFKNELSFKNAPQSDSSKPAIVAHIAWSFVTLFFSFAGAIQFYEEHPEFTRIVGFLGILGAFVVFVLLVRLGVRTCRAFVQGMREAG